LRVRSLLEKKRAIQRPRRLKKCTLKSTRNIRASSPTNHRAVASLGQLYSRRVLGTVPGSKARRFLPVIITVRGQKWWDCRCRRKKPPLQRSRGHLPTEGEVSTRALQEGCGFCTFPYKKRSPRSRCNVSSSNRAEGFVRSLSSNKRSPGAGATRQLELFSFFTMRPYISGGCSITPPPPPPPSPSPTPNLKLNFFIDGKRPGSSNKEPFF